MIKAVFFDFYNTLANFNPSREEIQTSVCREFGIQVAPDAITRGYWAADDLMSRENARFALAQRSPDELNQFWEEYEYTLLATAGVEVTKIMAFQIFSKVRRTDRKVVLFDDVLPALDALKKRGKMLGLISNLNRSLDQICDGLGLIPYLDFTLSSAEAGTEKPHPQIFLTALDRAGVKAAEAIHVGDQYHADVVGARSVGIMPLLLDRHGFASDLKNCQTIRTLAEVVKYL